MDPALRESEPAACVVAPRVVRRILKATRSVRVSGMSVPHGRCCWAPRASVASLTSVAERGELPAHDPLIMLADHDDPRELLRAAYHARVHLDLEGKLDVATVRARVDAIGQTAMDEIRAVLREDGALLPGSDEVEIWIELVATWAELARFEPDALSELFPSVDRALAHRIIALDLAGMTELPEPAPRPSMPLSLRRTRRSRTSRTSSPELRAAARAKGNLVRALLDSDEDPTADLAKLATRIRDASASRRELVEALTPLVVAAREAPVPTLSTEGRLLFDLQRAAIDHERDAQIVDVLGAIGRPIVRPLPMTKVVRVARRLRRALIRVPRTSLPRAEREVLRDALEVVAHDAETRLRDTLRPVVVAALTEVSLVPRGPAEETAREKLVDELLDRVVARGFLALGDLRDAISRNRLKCDDLTLRALVSGDELLRADALLADRLDGVYRRGEIYLRFLQRLSAIAFGTTVSRWISTALILPLLAAFVVLEGLQHVVGPLARKLAGAHLHLVSRSSILIGAVVVFLLIHSATARAVARGLLRAIGGLLYGVFVAAPVWLFTRPLFVAIAKSAPVTAVVRFVTRTPLFIALEEVVLDACGRAFRNVRTRIVPGLFALLHDVLRVMFDSVERLLYRVTEILLFREGESRFTLVLKGVGTAFARIVAFVVRLYVNLLIEPQVNPIKHFPVVTVSHKIMLPFLPALLVFIRTPLLPLGPVVANFVAGTTVFLLPGVFGFLAWELKENYRLYRAALSKNLEPVRIGSHGETMTALLVPGFHSGTIPKVRLSLRRSARRIARREPFLALAIRAHTRALTELHHVEEAIARFVEREVLALLARSPRWKGGALAVTRVHAASNRVVVSIGDLVIAFDEQSGFILAHVVDEGFARDLPKEQRAVLDEALRGMYALAGVDFAREDIEKTLDGAPYDVCDEGLMIWPNGDFSQPVTKPMSSIPRSPRVPWSEWSQSWSALGAGGNP